VIGRIQRWGKQSGKIDFQIGIRDSHKPKMFNFADQNPDKTPTSTRFRIVTAASSPSTPAT